MAKTFTPPYTQNPKISPVVIAAANTARDGSGSIVDAFTAGSEGSYVKKIRYIPAQASAGATSAKVFCAFYSVDGGTTWNFLSEIASPTSTPSTTAVALASTQTISFVDGFVLPPSGKIGVTQTVYAGVQDRTQVTVEASDY